LFSQPDTIHMRQATHQTPDTQPKQPSSTQYTTGQSATQQIYVKLRFRLPESNAIYIHNRNVIYHIYILTGQDQI
jgi:hypothetical protein